MSRTTEIHERTIDVLADIDATLNEYADDLFASAIREYPTNNRKKHPLNTPWTHSICPDCWYKRTLEGKAPVTITDRIVQTCCYCGTPTGGGIYVRDKPDAPRYCPHDH